MTGSTTEPNRFRTALEKGGPPWEDLVRLVTDEWNRKDASRSKRAGQWDEGYRERAIADETITPDTAEAYLHRPLDELPAITPSSQTPPKGICTQLCCRGDPGRKASLARAHQIIAEAGSPVRVEVLYLPTDGSPDPRKRDLSACSPHRVADTGLGEMHFEETQADWDRTLAPRPLRSKPGKVATS